MRQGFAHRGCVCAANAYSVASCRLLPNPETSGLPRNKRPHFSASATTCFTTGDEPASARPMSAWSAGSIIHAGNLKNGSIRTGGRDAPFMAEIIRAPRPSRPASSKQGSAGGHGRASGGVGFRASVTGPALYKAGTGSRAGSAGVISRIPAIRRTFKPHAASGRRAARTIRDAPASASPSSPP